MGAISEQRFSYRICNLPPIDPTGPVPPALDLSLFTVQRCDLVARALSIFTDPDLLHSIVLVFAGSSDSCF